MLHQAWTLAIKSLRLIELKGLSERLALVAALGKLKIQDSQAIGLAHRLLLETVRRLNFIDYIVNCAVAPASIKDFQAEIRAFLRLYTYEVKFGKNSDYERAANIASTGRSILGWRRLVPTEEALGLILSLDVKEIIEGLSDVEKTALRMFQPLWFVKYCFKRFGRAESITLFRRNNSRTPTYLRINTLKNAEQKIMAKMAQEGISMKKVEGMVHTYKLISTDRPLMRTSSFQNGLFYIQDKASCLATEVASPEAGAVVLDICAAPGAKTTYLAQLMENEGRIYSLDYSRRRMQIWKNGTHRMGVRIAKPIIGDACRSLPFRREEFDLVVLDPPCTSTGSFSQAPSSKWRLNRKSLRNMAALQWRMLTGCAEFIKKGGHIVYSTCSVTVEENEMIVERFLRRYPCFALVDAKPRIGLPGLRGQTSSQRLYPHVHECNGFYIAKLERQD